MGLAGFGSRTALITGGGTLPSAFSNKLRYVDMNAASGGVARVTAITTTFVTLFYYSGTGLFGGFVLTLDTAPGTWLVELEIDSNPIFNGGILLSDVDATTVYNFNGAGSWEPDFIGMEFRTETFRWAPLYPITFGIDVRVKTRKTSGTSNFLAGLAVLTKET